MFCNRPALLAASLLALAAPLRAQEKPTDAMMKAIAGTWQLDKARSDSAPPGLAALLNPRPERPAPDPATAVVSGGGGSRRGGGGGGGGSGSSARGLGARIGSAGNVRVFMPELRVQPTLVLKIGDGTAMTTDPAGFETVWKTDGKKRQVAQMEGGVVEYRGEWLGRTLALEKSIPGVGSVKREFKPLGDGELEVKVVLSVGKKVEQKLVYTRAP